MAKCGRVLIAIAFAAMVAVSMGCETMPERDRLVVTAEQAVSQGDWDAAMDPVLGSLNLKRDHKRSVELLQTIAPHYYQYHIAGAARARAVPDFPQAFYHFDRIREAEGKIQLLALVDGKSGEPLVAAAPDISTDYGAIQREAATQYYSDAFDFLDAGDPKQAAIRFRRADEVQPGFEDSRQRYNTARQQAMKRVVVLGGGAQESYASVAQNMLGKFVELRSGAEFQDHLEFVELIAPTDSGAGGLPVSVRGRDAGVQAARRLGAQYLLYYHINDVVNSETPVQTERRNAECMYPDALSAKIFGEERRQVRATVVFYTHQRDVGVNAAFELVRLSDLHVLESNTYVSRISDSYKWARYSGDSEALTCISGAKDLSQKPEGRAATAGELFARANAAIVRESGGRVGKALEGL